MNCYMRQNVTTSTNLVLLLIVMETFQNDLAFSSNHKSSLKMTNEWGGSRFFHWDKMSVTVLMNNNMYSHYSGVVFTREILL